MGKRCIVGGFVCKWETGVGGEGGEELIIDD